MHEIERTDAFTLVGGDAREGKVTLFEAESPRDRGVLERIVLRVPRLEDVRERLDTAGHAARNGDRELVVDTPAGVPLGIVERQTSSFPDLDHVVLRVPDPEATATALAGLGLEAWPKVSGSKGLQLYVPLNTPVTYAATSGFAHCASAPGTSRAKRAPRAASGLGALPNSWRSPPVEKALPAPRRITARTSGSSVAAVTLLGSVAGYAADTKLTADNAAAAKGAWKLDKSNWQKAEGLLPDVVLKRVKEGDYTFTVVPLDDQKFKDIYGREAERVG